MVQNFNDAINIQSSLEEAIIAENNALDRNYLSLRNILGPNSELSGVMTEDVHLTIDLSPYTVTGTITVEVGLNLTIDPGVVLKFNAATSKYYLHMMCR
jgi:hypothetical protein